MTCHCTHPRQPGLLPPPHCNCAECEKFRAEFFAFIAFLDARYVHVRQVRKLFEPKGQG